MIAYIREMQIKTTMKYYLTVVRMAIVKNLQVTNIEEGAEKTEPSYTVGENVSWCSHYGKQYGFLKKLKIELPHDSAIPLLGIYPDKTLIQKDTCTPMFTAALFTIAKIRKQPKRPIDRWADREAALHVYHGIISHKKSEPMPFAATRLQPEVIILSEVNQKDGYRMMSLTREI